LKWIVPRWEVLFFTKQVSSLKQAGLRDMFKMAFKRFCASTVAISPNTSPILSAFSAVKSPEDQKSQNPKPTAKGCIQMVYSCD
jgi:hypothetical protein